MGRTMPTECEHGTTIDYGDFGPCQDCSEHDEGECPNFRDCEQCQADREARWPAVLEELTEEGCKAIYARFKGYWPTESERARISVAIEAAVNGIQ